MSGTFCKDLPNSLKSFALHFYKDAAPRAGRCNTGNSAARVNKCYRTQKKILAPTSLLTATIESALRICNTHLYYPETRGICLKMYCRGIHLFISLFFHMIGVCLLSQSASRKNSREIKAHKPLRTSSISHSRVRHV